MGQSHLREKVRRGDSRIGAERAGEEGRAVTTRRRPAAERALQGLSKSLATVSCSGLSRATGLLAMLVMRGWKI
jgi:hypothetical protein